jgi:hypothetical protein
MSPEQRAEVNETLDTLRLLFGPRGVSQSFSFVTAIRNSTGSSLVVQCMSRNKGKKFVGDQLKHVGMLQVWLFIGLEKYFSL